MAIGIKEVLNNDLSGIIHIVGDKKLSMYDLAKITTPNIQKMNINDYAGPSLTMDMSLNSKKWQKYTLK